MLICVQYYDNELTIEEYESEYGTRYKSYSHETDEIQFNREGYIGYCVLINEWKELVDKLVESWNQ